MKTPVFTLRKKHTAELLDHSVKSNLDTVLACYHIKHDACATLQSLCQNLCYKVFFTGPSFIPEQRYTIADACQFIQGIFKTEMIDCLHYLVDFSITHDLISLQKVLRNCYSYELLSMLYLKPVRVYAALLGYVCLQCNELSLFDSCIYYLENDSKKPTLDWEYLYIKYLEVFENE